jgi:dTDP-4-dehydrorhamnose reductase
MKIGVFGASCRIGEVLCLQLQQQGHNLFSIGRTQSKFPAINEYFDINHPSVASLSTDVDCIIALGWIQSPRDENTSAKNSMAISMLAEFAQETGANFVFVSTVSTSVKKLSHYASAKLRCESLVGDSAAIVRLGTVIEGGEAIGSIGSTINKLKAFPFRLGVAPDIVLTTVDLMTASQVLVDASIYGPFPSLVTAGRQSSLNNLLGADSTGKKFVILCPRLFIDITLKLLSKFSKRASDALDSWNGLTGSI